jgi:ATP-dependent protease HslVU (ClpYQ) peptidase subunit
VKQTRSFTCIIGLVERGVVWIGGDSAATYTHSLAQRILATPKVTVLDAEMVIGSCGSVRSGNLLQYGFDRPKHQKGLEDEEYMATAFMDAVRERMVAGGHVHPWEAPEHMDGAFMVGYRGNIYIVESDYGIIRTHEPYAALGCGEDLALGCLAGTEGTRMSAKKRITKALEISERYSAGVKRPFVIVRTRGS